MYTLLTYGTLRPGKEKTILVPGSLYDLGWFPGIILGDGPSTVVCEPVEVDDFTQLDRYEGYHEGDPRSLYIRRSLLVPYGIDAYIYEYNRPVDAMTLIEGGDWLAYRQQSKGVSHGRFG